MVISEVKESNYLLSIPLLITSGNSHHKVLLPSAGVTISIAEGRDCSIFIPVIDSCPSLITCERTSSIIEVTTFYLYSIYLVAKIF